VVKKMSRDTDAIISALEKNKPRSFSEDMQEAFSKQDTTGQVQAIRELFDDSRTKKMKSEMNRDVNEAGYFAKLFVLDSKIPNSVLLRYCDENIELKVSNGRLGRKETVEMCRNTTPEDNKKGFFGRLFS